MRPNHNTRPPIRHHITVVAIHMHPLCILQCLCMASTQTKNVMESHHAWDDGRHLRRFSNLTEMHYWVQSLLSSNWWKKEFPHITEIYLFPKERGDACTYLYYNLARADVHLPRWAYNELIVLHELAHCVSDKRADHGPSWVRNFIHLVGRACGRDERDRLIANLREHHVRF